jgi:hypothetical protein
LTATALSKRLLPARACYFSTNNDNNNNSNDNDKTTPTPPDATTSEEIQKPPTQPGTNLPLDFDPKQPFYKHEVNYNMEQNKKYTRNLNAALQRKAEKDAVEAKIKSGELKIIERRRRKVYDKPKHDLSIENYHVYRKWENTLPKFDDHCVPVVCKVMISPAKLMKVFGVPNVGWDKFQRSATMEYNFEDSNWDTFLLYDYRETTDFWGPNKPNYDYENQSHIQPRKRRTKYPTREEFWASNDTYAFRINCTEYADFRKFRKWILQHMEEKENKPGLHERAMQKWGPLETYDVYDKKYPIQQEMSVFKYTKKFFALPGEKYEEKTDYHKPLTPVQKLGDQYIKKWHYAEKLAREKERLKALEESKSR